MRRLYTRMFILCIPLLFLYSCDDDTTVEPLIPSEEILFSTAIPDKARFDFAQTSALASTMGSYETNLSVASLTEGLDSLSYIVYVFEDQHRGYGQIDFIHSRSGVFSTDTLTINDRGSVVLSEMNTEVNLLKFKDKGLPFSGRYRGEATLLTVENDTVFLPEDFFILSGFVDMNGQLRLYAENDNDVFAYIDGILNSEATLLAESFSDDNSSLSAINPFNNPLIFDANTGTIQDTLSYNTGNQLLYLNLTKQ